MLLTGNLTCTTSYITHQRKKDFSRIFFDDDCDSEKIYICTFIRFRRKTLSIYLFFMMRCDMR